MNTNIRKKKNGYTILETVVYVSILAIIVMTALGSILTMYRAFGKTKIERKVTTNGEVALERIVREIRAATSTKATSVFQTHPGALALSTGETFTISNGIAQVQEDAAPAQNLTSSDVSVTNFVFYKTVTSNSEMIKVEMTVESGAGVFLKSRKFYGGAVMRGAY